MINWMKNFKNQFIKNNKIKQHFIIVGLIPLTCLGLSGCDSTSLSTSQPHKLKSNTITLISKAKDRSKQPQHTSTLIKKQVDITPISVPILEYHNNAYVRNWPWALDPGQFNREMAWLKENNFHAVTLQQVYSAYRYGTPLPSKPVAITFDDGHVSNYTMAYPILKRYGFNATEFVVTAAIGKMKGILTKEDLLKMQDSGVFEIESHTVHHPYLAKLPERRVLYEVMKSKNVLSKMLGRPVNFFCYPYGSYSPKVVEAVKKAGYLLATTVHFGYAEPVIQGPLTLDRLSVHEGVTLRTFESWFKPSFNLDIKAKSKSA